MGVVYEADDERLNRRVALKVLSPGLSFDEGFRTRFEREAALLARLDSPEVIPIYDSGEHDRSLYLVSPFFPEGDLQGYLAREPDPPSFASALSLVGDLLRGLGDAHQAGIVHRDIKPSNVLLRRRGDRLQAVLCDFGIATVAESDLTVTGTVIGSLAYMAPERHEGASGDVASDLYSVGCLLWVCVTGNPPYAGTGVQMAMAHSQAAIPQLSGDGVGVRGINRLLDSLMAKRPAERPPSALAALTAVEQVQVQVADTAAPKVVPPPDPAARTLGPRLTPASDELDPEAAETLARPVRRPVTGNAAETLARLGQPPASSPLPGSEPARTSSPSRRRARVGAALAAVLLIAGGTLVALLMGSDDSSDVANDDPTGGVGPAAAPPPTSTSPSSVEPPSSPALSPSPTKVTQVRCSGGVPARSFSRCPEPSGKPGLKWVFKDFNFDAECGGFIGRTRDNDVLRYIYNCPRSLKGYAFNFSEFDGPRLASDYYNDNFNRSGGGTYRDAAGVQGWRYVTDNGPKAALLYAGGRWGVTIYADTRVDLDRAVRTMLGAMRPADQMP